MSANGGVRLLHEMRAGSEVRYTVGSTELLAERNGRVLAAAPNAPLLVVSDGGCTRFRSITIDVAGFAQAPRGPKAYPFVAPMPTRITGVRWADDASAWVMAIRAVPNARFEAPPAPGSRPLPRGKGPWAETVVFRVDLRDGRVHDERVLSQRNWHFESDSEVVAHTFDEDARPGWEIYPILRWPVARTGR